MPPNHLSNAPSEIKMPFIENTSDVPIEIK